MLMLVYTVLVYKLQVVVLNVRQIKTCTEIQMNKNAVSVKL